MVLFMATPGGSVPRGQEALSAFPGGLMDGSDFSPAPEVVEEGGEPQHASPLDAGEWVVEPAELPVVGVAMFCIGWSEASSPDPPTSSFPSPMLGTSRLSMPVLSTLAIIPDTASSPFASGS
jgi:hypothetical protein